MRVQPKMEYLGPGVPRLHDPGTQSYLFFCIGGPFDRRLIWVHDFVDVRYGVEVTERGRIDPLASGRRYTYRIARPLATGIPVLSCLEGLE